MGGGEGGGEKEGSEGESVCVCGWCVGGWEVPYRSGLEMDGYRYR